MGNTSGEINFRYNLHHRTFQFSTHIISLANKLPHTLVLSPIIKQLIRSGTSIGANYCEADNAESKLDFKHKIGICKKEAKETYYWLDLLSTTVKNKNINYDLAFLKQESKELHLIFVSIIRKL